MGYGKEYWTNKMNQALSDLSTIAEKKEKFQKEPSVQLARLLADYASARNELKTAYAYLKKVKDLDPEAGKNLDMEMFRIVYSGFRANQFTLDSLKLVAGQVLNQQLADDRRARLLYSMVRILNKAPNDGQLLSDLKELINLIEKQPELLSEQNRQEIEILKYLFLEKETKKAVQKKKSTMANGWLENPEQLNRFAWWCFENRINLNEAEQLARKAIDLTDSPTDKADIYDTLAEILNLKGRYKEAIQAEVKAIKHDPQRKLFKKNLARFQKNLSEQRNGK